MLISYLLAAVVETIMGLLTPLLMFMRYVAATIVTLGSMYVADLMVLYLSNLLVILLSYKDGDAPVFKLCSCPKLHDYNQEA